MRDVLLDNRFSRLNAIRADRMSGFYLGNMTVQQAEFNAVVKKGDLLAEIDPSLLEAANNRDKAAVKTQRAEVLRIVALLEQAQRNQERAMQLRAVNENYISDLQSNPDNRIGTGAGTGQPRNAEEVAEQIAGSPS